MKPMRPSAGAAIMQAPATVLRKRWGLAEPNMEDLLGRGSLCASSTSTCADRYSDRVVDAAVQRDVRLAVGPHVDDPAAREGVAQLVARRRAHARQPERRGHARRADRKSTRLNSSHANTSYAVFCLKKTITS